MRQTAQGKIGTRVREMARLRMELAAEGNGNGCSSSSGSRSSSSSGWDKRWHAVSVADRLAPAQKASKHSKQAGRQASNGQKIPPAKGEQGTLFRHLQIACCGVWIYTVMDISDACVEATTAGILFLT